MFQYFYDFVYYVNRTIFEDWKFYYVYVRNLRLKLSIAKVGGIIREIFVNNFISIVSVLNFRFLLIARVFQLSRTGFNRRWYSDKLNLLMAVSEKESG